MDSYPTPSSSNYTLEPDNLRKDPRFKIVLNDVLKYGSKEKGKIVNFKFRPGNEKPNFYIRRYSPEKERIAETVKFNQSLFLDREPHHRYGLTINNSGKTRESAQSLDIAKTMSIQELNSAKRRNKITKIHKERSQILELPESLKKGMTSDFTPCQDRRMIERPNWRQHDKEKWTDITKKGILPSYHDFGRRTTNGFNNIVKGSLIGSEGYPTSSLERYNPYINSLHELGHKFRTRRSQKEISTKDFSSHTSKDIVMKSSPFLSKSIRGAESESKFKLAKKKLQKLMNPRYMIDRRFGNKFNFSPDQDDYNFDSPKRRNEGGRLEKYTLKISRSNSQSLNKDLPILQLKSSLTEDGSIN
ncbi:unnamed protein product [Moneuplotes crassus]|uniref:Uncharacterized protein n=1 Tax=Euplotes crassus TaxID=5936 RepID=A0AAD1ULK8_EUPCR|nr:unnamed protein product [Moneuplotes crassus]